MRRTAGLVIVITLAVAAVLLVRSLDRPRASGERMILGTQAEQVRLAMVVFERETGAPATGFAALERAGYVTSNVVAPFTYVGDATYVFVQTQPSRAVSAGEPWGGPGEKTLVDVPAARIVMRADGTVAWIDEAVFSASVPTSAAP